jgi:aldehyde dehydrogenase (NAD+)
VQFNMNSFNGLLSPISNGVSTGEKNWEGKGETYDIKSPVDGKRIGIIQGGTTQDVDRVITVAEKAFKEWRSTPPLYVGNLYVSLVRRLVDLHQKVGQFF